MRQDPLEASVARPLRLHLQDARDDLGRKKVDLVLEFGESFLRVLDVQILRVREQCKGQR